MIRMPTVHELDRAHAPFVEIYPAEIPFNPNTQPLEFVDFCRQRLVAIGIGLPTSEQEKGLYRDIDLMVFVDSMAQTYKRIKHLVKGVRRGVSQATSLKECLVTQQLSGSGPHTLLSVTL